MTEFSRIASEVHAVLSRISASDHDAEWQRVNSYIADVLKDSHVLYAKLARLQGDFAGEELARLSKVSEAVLAIGDTLSQFSKAFYEGKYEMLQSEFTYGDSGGAPILNPKTPPEAIEAGAGGSTGILQESDTEIPPVGPDESFEEPDEDEEVPDYESPEEEDSEEESQEPQEGQEQAAQ